MSAVVMSSKQVMDLSQVEGIHFTFITKNRSFLPSWSTEASVPPMSEEPQDGIPQDFRGCVSVKELFAWLGEHFVVGSGSHKFNDLSVNSNGKSHRLHLRLVRKRDENAYPIENLRVLYKHPWTIVSVQINKGKKHVSVFCSGRLQNQRPSSALRVEQDQLQLDELQYTKPPWWAEKNKRVKAKKEATKAAALLPS